MLAMRVGDMRGFRSLLRLEVSQQGSGRHIKPNDCTNRITLPWLNRLLPIAPETPIERFIGTIVLTLKAGFV